jgi:hypothetical protein
MVPIEVLIYEPTAIGRSSPSTILTAKNGCRARGIARVAEAADQILGWLGEGEEPLPARFRRQLVEESPVRAVIARFGEFSASRRYRSRSSRPSAVCRISGTMVGK